MDVISWDVIFMEAKEQEQAEGDSTFKGNTETTTVQVVKEVEAAQEHNVQEPAESEVLEVWRSTRTRKTQSWMTAMQEEIEAFHKSKIWELVLLPHGRKSIGNKGSTRSSAIVMIE